MFFLQKKIIQIVYFKNHAESQKRQPIFIEKIILFYAFSFLAQSSILHYF